MANLRLGVLIGLNMAVISVVTEWASDLKQGYCSAGWWLNKKFCCWEDMDPAGPGAGSGPKGMAALAAAAAANANTTSVASAIQTMTRLTLRSESPVAPVETCNEWIEWAAWTVPAWFVYIGFSALLAFSCAYLVKQYAPYAAGSGISEIKCVLSGFVIRGFLSAWTLVIKSLGLPLAIASGLSVGKEGPAVHVACCMGYTASEVFHWLVPSHAKLRELLTASSAAGVAVAFGSPVGGVLFALEEMTSHFPAQTMWRTFLCALASTVALSFMNPFRTGKLVLFQVEYNRDWHYFEIAFFLLLGAFGGLYGEYVARFNLQVQRFRRKRLANHGVAEAVILAVLTAMVSYFNRFMRIDMTESLEILFQQCDGASENDVLCQSRMQWSMATSLLLATILRFMFVVLSYGCKVPAGIFIPSMAVGATFGRMIGILVKAMQSAFPSWSMFAACNPHEPCITPGTYAMLGAAAGLAGVTRITVAVVVIMFELTGALTYILPIMLVVGTAKLVADLNGKGGISDRAIKFNGYPYLEQEEHIFGAEVGSLIQKQPDALYADGMKLSDIEKYVSEATYRGFPVVSSRNDATVLGYVERNHLRYAIDQTSKLQSLTPEVVCKFYPKGTEEYALTTAQMPKDLPETMRWGSGAFDEPDYILEESMEVDSGPLDLGSWVDPTPLMVQPELDLEVVAEMFKSLGPRVILVCKNGQLQGLVTIKDLIRHLTEREKEEQQPTYVPANMQDSHMDTNFMVGSGELEETLELTWQWMTSLTKRFKWWPNASHNVDNVPLTTVTTVHQDE